jgi:hypothetical protein
MAGVAAAAGAPVVMPAEEFAVAAGAEGAVMAAQVAQMAPWPQPGRWVAAREQAPSVKTLEWKLDLRLWKEPALGLWKEPALKLSKGPALSLSKGPALSLSNGLPVAHESPGLLARGPLAGSARRWVWRVWRAKLPAEGPTRTAPRRCPPESVVPVGG